MKEIILLTAMLLAMTSSVQAANRLTAVDNKTDNVDVFDLVISMENDIEVGGYDFHLYLPVGIALAYDEGNEDFLYELSDRHNKKHQLTIMYDETDDSYMFGVSDPSLHKIAVGSGKIIRLKLIVTDPELYGTRYGSIRNVWFAESGSSGVEVDDVEFEIHVAIHDVLQDSQESKFYNLQGQQVANGKLPRGVYVTEGKKIVKK